MANVDSKIPFTYCRIGRAAEFLDMHTFDLLSLGACGKIGLCVRLNGMGSILSLDGNVEKHEDWYASLDYDHSVLAPAKYISTYTSFSIDNIFENDDFSPGFYPRFYKARRGDDTEDENWSQSHRGRAYGLWILPTRIINTILIDGTASAGGVALGFNKSDENTPSGWLFPLTIAEINEGECENGVDSVEGDEADEGYEEIYEKLHLTENDLWITAETVRRLVDFNGDYYNLEPGASGIAGVKNHEIKRGEIVHHSSERHAGNREQILMAALRLREQQSRVFEEYCRKPNGEINYSAWARELINRPDFFINQTAPIKTEAKIAEILSNAHKSPSERKT